MKQKTVWVLEFTIETKVPMLGSHQASIENQIFSTKDAAQMHADWAVESYMKKGWEITDEPYGKSFHKSGCISHGYRIREMRVKGI